jgi:hypothetical protein
VIPLLYSSFLTMESYTLQMAKLLVIPGVSSSQETFIQPLFHLCSIDKCSFHTDSIREGKNIVVNSVLVLDYYWWFILTRIKISNVLGFKLWQFPIIMIPNGLPIYGWVGCCWSDKGNLGGVTQTILVIFWSYLLPWSNHTHILFRIQGFVYRPFPWCRFLTLIP